MHIQDAIKAAVSGQDLSMDDAAETMGQIMEGDATPAQFGAFVTALRLKGESPSEIAGMANAMRQRSLHVETDVDGPIVDTCGTGGDSQGTFNISTAAAFVIAGAGVTVAKHGNRAMSGASGSSDVLESLGVKIELGPEEVGQCIKQAGIGFMFAQVFHPAMKYAAPPRREIGIRTVFNLLGPLTNPARASRQIIGIADVEAAPKVAEALKLLGTDHALIVHGEDGSDEIAVQGDTRMWQVADNTIRRRVTRPSDFGLPPGNSEHLSAPSVERSRELILGVLAGKGGGHNAPTSVARSARTAVLINAGAAIVIAGKAADFQEGAVQATASVESGAAQAKLDELARLSHKLAR